jgi:hypothetical protein
VCMHTGAFHLISKLGYPPPHLRSPSAWRTGDAKDRASLITLAEGELEDAFSIWRRPSSSIAAENPHAPSTGLLGLGGAVGLHPRAPGKRRDVPATDAGTAASRPKAASAAPPRWRGRGQRLYFPSSATAGHPEAGCMVLNGQLSRLAAALSNSYSRL